MYERFTTRARKVMQLANQEAQRFKHEYIGTEHILLGLIKEDNGVAGSVLKNFGLDLGKIQLEVEKLVQSGPTLTTVEKLPQTPRGKKVIEYAMEEARSLTHKYVGTEHLLLGMLREGEGVAAQVLMNLGLHLASVRAEVIRMVAGTDMTCDTVHPPEDFGKCPLITFKEDCWGELTWLLLSVEPELTGLSSDDYRYQPRVEIYKDRGPCCQHEFKDIWLLPPFVLHIMKKFGDGIQEKMQRAGRELLGIK